MTTLLWWAAGYLAVAVVTFCIILRLDKVGEVPVWDAVSWSLKWPFSYVIAVYIFTLTQIENAYARMQAPKQERTRIRTLVQTDEEQALADARDSLKSELRR